MGRVIERPEEGGQEVGKRRARRGGEGKGSGGRENLAPRSFLKVGLWQQTSVQLAPGKNN